MHVAMSLVEPGQAEGYFDTSPQHTPYRPRLCWVTLCPTLQCMIPGSTPRKNLFVSPTPTREVYTRSHSCLPSRGRRNSLQWSSLEELHAKTKSVSCHPNSMSRNGKEKQSDELSQSLGISRSRCSRPVLIRAIGRFCVKEDCKAKTNNAYTPILVR